MVVPTPDYVAFAAHYGFRPDFCEAADPESKGIVENLVGYAKTDLMIPGTGEHGVSFSDVVAANAAAAAWCAQVNGVEHSEICAVPAERLRVEQELLATLPSLRPSLGRLLTRKVDRLSCVRFASAPLLGADTADRHRSQVAGRRRPQRRDHGRRRRRYL